MSSKDPCSVLYPETTAQLPLFGYTVYVVLRVSKLVLPGPVLLGLNRQHLVLMDPSSQVCRVPVLVWAGTLPTLVISHTIHCYPLCPGNQFLVYLLPQKLCCSITLKDLQRLHLLSPLQEDGPPGLELNYGSADNPKTIWLELPQVSDQACGPKEGGVFIQLRWWECGAALSRLCIAGPGAAAHHHLPAGQHVLSVARAPLRRMERRQPPCTAQSALVLL